MASVKNIKCYKSVFTRDFDHNISEHRELMFDRSFDEKGNKISESTFINEEPDQNLKFEYDSNGQLIKEHVHFASDDLEEISEYKYNDKGQIIERKKTFPAGDTSTTYYNYEDDKVVGKETKDSDDELEEREVFKYDGKNLVRFEQYNWNDTLTAYLEYKYDSEGLVQEETRWNEGEDILKMSYDYSKNKTKPDITISNQRTGRVIEAWRYQFDDKGRMGEEVIETIVKTHQKLITRYSYDEKDRIVEVSKISASNLPEHKTTYLYNGDNLIEEISETIEESGNSFKDSSLKYEYEFVGEKATA